MNGDWFVSCLSDATRFSLLSTLAEGDATVAELVEATGHSQSNVSHHLRQLRDCGFVTFERDGRTNVYSLRDQIVAEVLDLIAEAAATLEPHCASGVCA